MVLLLKYVIDYHFKYPLALSRSWHNSVSVFVAMCDFAESVTRGSKIKLVFQICILEMDNQYFPSSLCI